ncbi:MAG: 1-deoxy-D-xylulose-5-phosphate reductoisomerase [Streptosporangiales bacterium]|nr:1-deoxy-D-xylulose-5-phosphate reductoisomerase [Streptosporangiales bacterium]
MGRFGVGGARRENGCVDPSERATIPPTFRVPEPGRRRDVVILGSTGSIGTQAVDVVKANPDRFRVTALAAGGGRVDLLAEQALELGVKAVAVAKAGAAEDLQLAFYAEAKRRGFERGEFAIPAISAGPDAVAQLAGTTDLPCDVVLNGITGSLGLASTIAALSAGHLLALANKESLIVGGPLVKRLAAPGQIVPVDSEHSALAQCLAAGDRTEVRRLVVTASGGPFRGRSRAELAGVTPEQALNHPTWDMGPVITINSATLVNKGLEVIEAHLLFDVPFDDIEVVVHPQSMIHSMVEFVDGTTFAHAGPPNMRLPIAYALGHPKRVPEAAPPVDWTKAQSWTFEPLDHEVFPAVRLAAEAGRRGRTVPAVYNAANEECVQAFLEHRLPFTGIVDTVARVVSEHETGEGPLTLDDVLRAETWARERARELTSAETAGVRGASG